MLLINYDCGCIHSAQYSRCKNCAVLSDPHLCSTLKFRKLVLPTSRRCTDFRARLLEVKCRRPSSWELPLAILDSTDTGCKGVETPLQQDTSVLNATSIADKTTSQTQEGGHETAIFQLHRPHDITEIPMPQGAWLNGRWKPRGLAKKD